MQDKYVSVLRAGYLSMDVGQNLIIIRTVSGMAMALATAIDALDFPQILGCIAGDDTIMVALKSEQEAMSVMEEMQKMIKGAK